MPDTPRHSSGKVLVTGADGFIGSHLVEALVRRGADVRAMALYNSLGAWGWLDDLPEDVQGRFEVVLGDVRDPGSVRQAMQGCTSVLHLAALIAIPYSYHAPDSYIDTNIRGTLNVLQTVRDLEIERLVVTSTSEVYGTAQRVPIDEDHPLVGQSPYSASKIGADQLALSFHRSFGTPVVLLRPFNTYGPRQSARAVIPTIVTQLLAGAAEIKLGALAPTRDFTYVADTAAGFVQALDCDAAVGETVNIGSGFEISVGDTAALIAEVIGSEAQIVEDSERLRPTASEVERLLADATKAGRLFDWQPPHAGQDGFRRGLELTIEWFRRPENLARYRADRYTL